MNESRTKNTSNWYQLSYICVLHWAVYIL